MKDGVLHQPVDSRSRDRVLERLARVLGNDPRVDFAFLYGSFAEDRPFHDVDVGVYLQSDRGDEAPVADYAMANRESVDAACYRLLVGIEAAIALCYHISAVHLRRVPEQYAACFETLREAGIVPDDLAGRLKAMARFRNLLVHMYKRVEPPAVHDILRNSLPDLRAFAAAVVQLI